MATDTDFDLSKPVQGLSDSDWDGLGDADRRWHHERQAIIGRAQNGKFWVSGNDRARYGISARDLASQPARVPAVQPDGPSFDADAALADVTAGPTLEAITDELDIVEHGLVQLPKALTEAINAHTLHLGTAKSLNLDAEGSRKVADAALPQLQAIEDRIVADLDHIEGRASSALQQVGAMQPAPEISQTTATATANLLAVIRPELQLLSTPSLVARLRSVDRTTPNPMALAHVTVARERLAGLAPDDTSRATLQGAILPLANLFVDQRHGARQRDQAHRVLAEVSRLRAEIRDMRQERGEHPAWLGDLVG